MATKKLRTDEMSLLFDSLRSEVNSRIDIVQTEVDGRIDNIQKDMEVLKIEMTSLKDWHIDERQLLSSVKESQDTVLNRLDKVSANGSPGLEASLKDIYQKLAEVHTQIFAVQLEEAKKWYNLTLIQLFRKSWMKPFWIVIMIVILNSIGHQFGVGLDLQSILKIFAEK